MCTSEFDHKSQEISGYVRIGRQVGRMERKKGRKKGTKKEERKESGKVFISDSLMTYRS